MDDRTSIGGTSRLCIRMLPKVWSYDRMSVKFLLFCACGQIAHRFLSHQEITTNISLTSPEVKTPDVSLPL